jgi:hypothetical protein
MVDHKQIEHDLDIKSRLIDYMDELDKMSEDVDPGEVRHRLRSILERFEDAFFEKRVRASSGSE